MLEQILYRDLNPCLMAASENLINFSEVLEEIGAVDFDSGSVNYDARRLSQVVQEMGGGAISEEHVAAFTALADDGFAVLSSQARGQRENAGVPWRMLYRPADAVPFLLPETLEAVGIHPGLSVEDSQRTLQERHPNVPDYVANERAISTLQHVSMAANAQRGVESLTETVMELDRTHNPSVGQVVDCLRAGRFSTHWWGWSVCLPRNCADMFQDAIAALAFGPLAAGVKAFVGAVSAGAAVAAAGTAAVAAVGGPLIVALVIFGAYLWVSINFNKTSRGVCIQGTWPIYHITGVSMGTWAKGI